MLTIKTSFNRALFWFIGIPCLIVGAASFFLPMSPFAFAKVLNKGYEIEQHKKTLETTLEEMLHSPESVDRDERVRILSDEIEETKHALLAYKHDWGNSYPSGMTTYRNGMISCGDALIPFCVLTFFVTFLLALALTAYHPIPFFIRTTSFITGNIFAVITLAQWIVAGFTVPSWYTRITALFLVPLALALLFFCWQYFLQKILWKKN